MFWPPIPAASRTRGTGEEFEKGKDNLLGLKTQVNGMRNGTVRRREEGGEGAEAHRGRREKDCKNPRKEHAKEKEGRITILLNGERGIKVSEGFDGLKYEFLKKLERIEDGATELRKDRMSIRGASKNSEVWAKTKSDLEKMAAMLEDARKILLKVLEERTNS